MSIARPSPQQRFLELLQRDILKLDAAELDFGIYRILNYRRAQIQAFLNETLPARIGRWADELAAAHGDRPLAESEAENCYYHLHTFFSRYWDDGDFIPRARRGGTAAYAVPWNGQDTHFHWATKGSHYVKSGELFTRYAYRDGANEIRFVIAQADIAKDNAKGPARYFFPARLQAIEGGFELSWEWRAPTDAESNRFKKTAGPSGAADGEATLAVEGGTLQDRVLAAWLTGAEYKGAKPAKGLDPELLARNARRFVRRNTGDFFVHPQLGTFLRGELDVYLKHEFVQVWDAPPGELARIRDKFKLVREIGEELIAFLDQIERFQASLFEKRKFVLQADYLAQCSWLLREAGEVGRALVDEAAGSAAQAAEWARWVGDTAKKPNGRKLLDRYPHLSLHTRHFDSEFKARLLATFPDLESALGGELVHADNYAAIRTLQPTYQGRLNCIYIDPPYNTDASPIDYKNGFRESSWLSMMNSRTEAALRMSDEAGVMCIAIDDAENASLRAYLEHRPETHILGTVAVRANPSGRPTKSGFSVSHEYVHFIGKTEGSTIGKMNPTDDQAARFSETDEEGAFEWRNLRREGSNSDRSARRALYYPLYVSDKAVRIPVMTWDDDTEEWVVSDSSRRTETVAWPIDDKGNEKTWRWSHEKVASTMKDVAVRKDRSGKNYVYYKRRPNEEGVVAVTSWFDAKYSATEHGTALLKKMFGKSPFSYPKSVHAVQDSIYVAGASKSRSVTLDFFAGSGTTGHAVVNLNREDGGARKFLLVEQGEYFDRVTLPRIAKVMASPDWKDGSPRDEVQHDPGDDPEHWSRRTLPLVRVVRLERYEDSLNALEFQPDDSAGELPLLQQDADEHLLRYWLTDDARGAPVQLSTSSLTDPFSYRLTLHEPTGPREATVDMVESARLLLGLVPRRHREVVHDGRRHVLVEASLASELARGTVEPGAVLLWLRPAADGTDARQAHADHAWLATAVRQVFARQLGDYATVYHNRGAFWPAGIRGQSIDALLAERMMEKAQ